MEKKTKEPRSKQISHFVVTLSEKDFRRLVKRKHLEEKLWICPGMHIKVTIIPPERVE